MQSYIYSLVIASKECSFFSRMDQIMAPDQIYVRRAVSSGIAIALLRESYTFAQRPSYVDRTFVTRARYTCLYLLCSL